MAASNNGHSGYPAQLPSNAANNRNNQLLAATHSHSHSRSQPQLPGLGRYISMPVVYHNNPISHYGNQYTALHSAAAFMPQSQAIKPNSAQRPSYQMKHIVQHSGPVETDNAAHATKNNKHARNSSLSYIQQKQSSFFTDIPEPTSDSDDDVYDEMYRDGMGADSEVIQQKLGAPPKPSRSKRKKANKSREETEDVWCCSVCTYQNNMLLTYCELCGCKKPEVPSIIKRAVAPESQQPEEMSPSPSPMQSPPATGLDLLALNLNESANVNASANAASNDSNNKAPQFENMLPLSPKQVQHHQQIPPNLLNVPSPTSPIGHRKGLHRQTRSETNVLMTKQNALKYWQCSVCTFAENPIEYPVCKVCSALPPERPPSPNPPFNRGQPSPKQQIPSTEKSLFQEQEEALDVLSNSHLNGNQTKKVPIANLMDEETDPLGHQKSTSITQLPIMDQSSSHRKVNNNNNSNAAPAALIDFGFDENVTNNMSAMSKSMPVQSGLLPSFDPSPELPPEFDEPDKVEPPRRKVPAANNSSNAGSNKPIADLGVDLNADDSANQNKSGGIGGFFGKVYSGWNQRRTRAQSSDNSLSPDSSQKMKDRTRSKSPFGRRSSRDESGGANNSKDKGAAANDSGSKRNISVATMPKKQQEKIAKRLGGLHTKKDLLKELDSSMTKLQKKLKQHANRVMQLKSEINVMTQTRDKEHKQWTSWYVLELVDLAKEYYETRLSFLNHQIELEKLHIECFTEKLQRLENASKAIKRNGKKWNIDDVRNNIEVAFHTAWRIRLSQDVPDKQDYVKQLHKVVESLKHNYDSKVVILGKAEISIEERKEEVFLFLQSTLAKYESRQMATNKSFKLSRNLENEEDFYCPYDETDQNKFDSFILDQRTKEGRIVFRWLVFIKKKHQDITFEDLADFMQKLAHTFLHTYSLPNKQYYECVRILCYRCVFRQRIIKKIIYDLLNTKPTGKAKASGNNQEENPEVVAMQQVANLDQVYQKKVMWMRALNDEQLGIKEDYWMQKKEIKFNDSLNAPKSQNGRRSSQIALIAGRDIPFAEAINLMGQLEMDYSVIQQYKEYYRQRKQNAQPAEQRSPRRSVFGRSGNSSNNNQAEDEEEKKYNDKRAAKNIIPFVLPQEGLQTLLAATKCVYNTAMEYYYQRYPEKKDDKNDDGAFISQDDLFPIILYCVMQSKLETPHRLIYFIEHILPKEKTTMGQSAFALSALKAAVEYISQAKPETFGMDAEIELD
mmetsp:Transcript_20524/g.32665  ORF Transcript_20524/g.32665 Transcript_20524/m.32665 type:complete len:1240 (-) Transcript_20524:181-3900(-)